MRFATRRSRAALLIGTGGDGPKRRAGQSGKPAAPPHRCRQDNQRKTDQFLEASTAINGPAGNPECVWLGRRVVRLMWLDDLDTAFRHLDCTTGLAAPGPRAGDVPLPDPFWREIIPRWRIR
jgi:hypothetical protein